MSSFTLDLTRIPEGTTPLERVYPAAMFEGSEDLYRLSEPVRLAGEVTRDKENFWLIGTLAGSFELSCSRCLESYALPVRAEFDLLYVPHSRNTGEGEREVEDDDLTTAFYQRDEIDLQQLIREQFYLVAPMKPLCRVTCAGLCAQCGANLNHVSCDCERQRDDPRLAGLRALLVDAKRPNGS